MHNFDLESFFFFQTTVVVSLKLWSDWSSLLWWAWLLLLFWFMTSYLQEESWSEKKRRDITVRLLESY